MGTPFDIEKIKMKKYKSKGKKVSLLCNTTESLKKFQKILQFIRIYKKVKKKTYKLNISNILKKPQKYKYLGKKNNILLNKFKLYSTTSLKKFQKILQLILNNRRKMRIRNFDIKKNQKIVIKKNVLPNK